MIKLIFRRIGIITLLMFTLLPAILFVFSTSVNAAPAKPTNGKVIVHALKFTSAENMPEILGDGSKLEELPEGATPAADISYAVVSLQGSSLGNSPSQEEALKYYESVKEDNNTPKSVGKTNSEGIFETKTLPADRYLVLQVEEDEEVASVPIVLSIPMMNQEGTGWNDTIHVYTKNVNVLGAARIQKISEDDKPLTGALFSLYRENETGNDHLIKDKLASHSDGYTDIVGNLILGEYYFLETHAPEGFLIQGEKVHFSITTDNHAYDENGALMEDKILSLSLKNYKKPNLEKDRITGASTDIGQTVSWKITADIPKNIEHYTEYVITDTLEKQLTYSGNLQILLDDAVMNPAHYAVSISGNVVNIKFIDSTFALGKPALQGKQKMEITFDTVLNEQAVPGTLIPNNAVLTMHNGYTRATATEKTPPTVETGARKFIKQNSSQRPLEGAEFIVYKTVNGTNQYMHSDSRKRVTWSSERSDATVLRSSNRGTFEVFGLAYGTYNLIETKAPDGYNLLTAPQEFIVDRNSYSADARVVVLNTSAPTLPVTGGIGTLVFFVAGLLLMGCALIIYRRNYKQV